MVCGTPNSPWVFNGQIGLTFAFFKHGIQPTQKPFSFIGWVFTATSFDSPTDSPLPLDAPVPRLQASPRGALDVSIACRAKAANAARLSLRDIAVFGRASLGTAT